MFCLNFSLQLRWPLEHLFTLALVVFTNIVLKMSLYTPWFSLNDTNLLTLKRFGVSIG